MFMLNIKKAILKMALEKKLITISEFSSALEKLEMMQNYQDITCNSST